MRQMIYPKSRLVQKLSRRVPLNGSPTATQLVPDGEEEIYYSVEIDLHNLEALARRAAKNGGGQAVDGPLRVKVLSRRRL
jgi:hypothetical protein